MYKLMRINGIAQFYNYKSKINLNNPNTYQAPVSFSATNALSNEQITNLARHIIDIPSGPEGKFKFDMITFDLLAKRDLNRLNQNDYFSCMALIAYKVLPDNLRNLALHAQADEASANQLKMLEMTLHSLKAHAVKIMKNLDKFEAMEAQGKFSGDVDAFYPLAEEIKKNVVAELNETPQTIDKLLRERGLKPTLN